MICPRSVSAMDGLIKGLINVALDHVQGGGGGDRDDDSRRDRDEQPRSSWSQVSTRL